MNGWKGQKIISHIKNLIRFPPHSRMNLRAEHGTDFSHQL